MSDDAADFLERTQQIIA